MKSSKNIGIYLRISKEDKNEHNSIVNQRNIIHNFIKNNAEFKESNIFEYIDNGFSGTDFNRKAIQQLFLDINDKKIDCIIVKDLSRFGRNYIQVGKYLENIFPFLNVRFISINDNFDSKNKMDISKILDINFRSIIYDYYSKDLSKKIISSKNSRAKQGKFLGSKAPFGYKKGIEDRCKLEIEEESSKIVKEIFDLFLSDKNCSQIAQILNENNIKTPITFLEKNKIHNNLLWKTAMVRKILQNKVYIGILEYSKTSKSIVNQKRTIYNDKKDWIITENAHDSIISKEDFEKVQNMLKHNKKHTTRQKRTIFAYKLYCGHCGYALTYSTTRYYCKNGRYDIACKNCSMEKEKLEEIVLQKIQTFIFENLKENVINTDKIVKKYENQILNLKNEKFYTYEQYSLRNIDKENCLQIRQNLDDKISLIENKIKKIKTENSLWLKFKESEKRFDTNKLNFELVDFFVDKIILTDTLVNVSVK